jgi:hypothetical protein
MHNYLRWKLDLLKLPEGQKEALDELIRIFDKWLEKMPDIKEWKIVLRWDQVKYWEPLTEWRIADLDAYSSCAVNKENIFIWKKYKTDLLVEVEVLRWRVKDITRLAFFPNFAKKVGRIPTTEEALILRGSKVRIKEIERWHKFEAWDWSTQDITRISTTQTK